MASLLVELELGEEIETTGEERLRFRAILVGVMMCYRCVVWDVVKRYCMMLAEVREVGVRDEGRGTRSTRQSAIKLWQGWHARGGAQLSI